MKSKNLCFQCLTPGLKGNHDGRCFDKYKCPDESHKRFQFGLHILICDRHKNNKANLELLEDYKSKYLANSSSSHKDFSMNISISFHVNANVMILMKSKARRHNATNWRWQYMLQIISVDNQKLNLFFDSGCGDMVCRKKAVRCLQNKERARNVLHGPLILSGVGDHKSVCEYGKYQITIPLYNGKNIKLSGICLDKIMGTFPSYPLEKIDHEIHNQYASSGGGGGGGGVNPSTLSKLPKYVGGDTGIMIGIRYLKYYPEKVYTLPNGLSIYKSQFLNSDGSRGLVGGPHRIFTKIHKCFGGHLSLNAYLTDVVNAYQNGYKLSLDVSLLDIKKVDAIFSEVRDRV